MSVNKQGEVHILQWGQWERANAIPWEMSLEVRVVVTPLRSRGEEKRKMISGRGKVHHQVRRGEGL